MKRYKNPGCSGFTIVETIVSVAIIGILAAAVVTTVLSKSEAVQAENVSPNDTAGGTVPDNSTPSTAGLGQIVSLSGDEDVEARAELASRRMEQRIVQTAMDLMMVSEDLKGVNATSDTTDMSAFPAGHPLYPRYLREATAQFKYSCDRKGEVRQGKP